MDRYVRGELVYERFRIARERFKNSSNRKNILRTPSTRSCSRYYSGVGLTKHIKLDAMHVGCGVKEESYGDTTLACVT
jgi:hypothetical protein